MPSGLAKREFAAKKLKQAKMGAKTPTTTTNMARVHSAQPSYSVVVPAPELCSINVAVGCNIGMIGALRKGKVALAVGNSKIRVAGRQPRVSEFSLRDPERG